MLCEAQAGPMTVQSGLDPVPASLSARQAKAAGLLTSGTYGRRGSGLSSSYVLQSSLANRLARVTALLGSTLFALTWKQRTTPQGYLISALRASARRTSGSGFTGWPTPTSLTPAQNGNSEAGNSDNLQRMTDLAAWPTPNAMEGGQTSRGGDRKDELLMGGLVSARPTPKEQNARGTTPKKDGLWDVAQLASPRATPQVDDANNVTRNSGQFQSLTRQAQLTRLPTPSARDWRDGRASPKTMDRNARPLNEIAVQLMDVGATPSGSTAGMASGGQQDGESAHLSGQLNPALPRWLQGLPLEWDQAAIAAYRTIKAQKRG